MQIVKRLQCDTHVVARVIRHLPNDDARVRTCRHHARTAGIKVNRPHSVGVVTREHLSALPVIAISRFAPQPHSVVVRSTRQQFTLRMPLDTLDVLSVLLQHGNTLKVTILTRDAADVRLILILPDPHGLVARTCRQKR